MLALGPTATAALALVKGPHGRNIRHKLLGSMQRAFHGHSAHYEAVDGALHLARDPTMRTPPRS